MASFLEEMKNEIYDYFDAEIVPMIKTQEHNEAFLKALVNKFNGKFGVKYTYIARKYDDTVRVSINYRPLGIVFFVAQTKDGKERAKFVDPCYWGK